MASPAVLDIAAEALLAPWRGPYGGLPPFDRASPAVIERAMVLAIDRKREEARTIATSTAPPTFANTVEALEDSGRELRRVEVLYDVFNACVGTDDMRAVQQRIAPMRAALDDEIAHDGALYGRVASVYARRRQLGLDTEQQRLLEVVHQKFCRAGAALARADQQRLQAINARLAELAACFGQNLSGDSEHDLLIIDDVGRLEGVPARSIEEFAEVARRRGLDGRWAIPNARPQVWAVLTHCLDRDVRERAWRMWDERGHHDGPRDNRPVLAQMLRLRGEKARLLGYPTFAHYMLADRMMQTPEAALDLMQRTWSAVATLTRARIAEYQALADLDGARITLAPWDRQFYAERQRRARFGVDGDDVRQYLPLEAMLEALFWLARRVHGLEFSLLKDVPVVDPSIRVYGIRREGESFGVLYLDLFQRPGKMHGSYQAEYRTAETFRAQVLPISAVVSGLPVPRDGETVLLPWEYANVVFHEFGHALHILSSGARYPTLGSVGVAWDLIELPSLLNERWLRDPELLARYAHHHASGEPMPPDLIERLERVADYDRVFSVNLDYLAPAILDMRVHLLADGREIDAVQLERELCAELGMPSAWDMIMRVTSNWHSFVGPYAAGLYSYLWADVMAADVTEAFRCAPGGFYDIELARRWRESVLTVGNTVPAGEAFRNFLGRDPDADALLRRYGLLTNTGPA
jgi:peptidyl-dipeptidase Dcp